MTPVPIPGKRSLGGTSPGPLKTGILLYAHGLPEDYVQSQRTRGRARTSMAFGHVTFLTREHLHWNRKVEWLPSPDRRLLGTVRYGQGTPSL